MTTEIEKELFEKYGVIKVQRCSLDSNNCPFGFSHQCSECDVDDVMIYTPITADKVLRLEELLFFDYGDLQIQAKSDGATFKEYKYFLYQSGKYHIKSNAETRVEALCFLLAELHPSLTPQERNEVVNILES